MGNVELIVSFTIIFIVLGVWLKQKLTREQPSKFVSVNYHFTRKCNYECGFCFHTQKSGGHLELEEAKRGVELLKEAGTRKLNFAGGEPFLFPKFVGELAKHCKQIGIESVSIVSNASKIRRSWFLKYGEYIDVLAVSIDSCNEETNQKIGRRLSENSKQSHVGFIRNAAIICKEFGIKFKINTVVNAFNYQEDMNNLITELNPCRWKVFQVLELEGENSGENSHRNVKPFLITTQQFQSFLERHKEQLQLVPESNADMQTSYQMLDEEMRFLDCSTGGKIPTKSILEVGVHEASRSVGFDVQKFVARDGIYDWKKTSCFAGSLILAKDGPSPARKTTLLSAPKYNN